ncbi:hypothetical protein [Candidatus Sororendozoicomonas aggregata]|uniref:hypothetical protein n=1 Tax=Candidatus Sororendozoicomonas aggregata TaxID=3073239 RepID=UPI002ED03D85
MKKIHAFIAIIMLTNYTFASKETWKVVHNASWDGTSHYVDDGYDYVVKPVGNGYCLNYETMPRNLTVHAGNPPETSVGAFSIDFTSDIFFKCGYEHSSQDFEVHSLTYPRMSATFQWYSPYAKSSRIKVVNDQDHIVMTVKDRAPNTIYIGK